MKPAEPIKIEVPELDAKNLTEYALLVKFKVKQFYPSKTDKELAQETTTRHGMEYDRINVTKRLIKGALDDWQKTTRALRQYHYDNTLPWEDDGRRIIAGFKVREYEQFMADGILACEAIADRITEQWPKLVEDDRTALGDKFNSDDYPDPDSIREKFSVAIEFDKIPSTNDWRIRDLNVASIESIRKKTEERMNETIRVALKEPLVRLSSALERVVSTLGDPEARFHYTMLTGLAELVNVIPSINLGQDKRLNEVAERLSRVVGEAIDPAQAKEMSKALREDEAARERIASKAKEELDKVADFLGEF